jgi:hypothetical protein
MTLLCQHHTRGAPAILLAPTYYGMFAFGLNIVSAQKLHHSKGVAGISSGFFEMMLPKL